nr:putative protein TPRXL; partial [Biomphalaria glabrata]
MAEGGDHSRRQGYICARCIQNRTYQSRTWASPDTSEGLHSQNTPETAALPDPNNGIYRINNLIPSETRTSTSAPQRINNAMPLNDLTEIRQTLDVISNGSTFSTQPSSTPSSNLLSSNNPPYLMSSTVPNTSQLSLNIPSGTVPESSIASSNQSTLHINNNTMARAEGNSESEAEVDRNLPEEVSMPKKEIIDRRKQLCPHNDTDECDDDCPYLHGRICHMCHTHRINPNNPGLHFNSLSSLPDSNWICNNLQILGHMSTIKTESYGVDEK